MPRSSAVVAVLFAASTGAGALFLLLRPSLPEPTVQSSTVAVERGPGYVLALYGYELSRAPAGSYWKGSPADEPFRSRSEGWEHVEITSPFYIGTTEVPQGLWRGVLGDNPSASRVYGYNNELCAQWGVDDALPVTCVRFDEVVTFLNVLSKLEDLAPVYRLKDGEWVFDADASGYRLPIEEEWEYAVRAGAADTFSGTSDPDALCEFANVATRMTKDRYPNWLRSKVFSCEDNHIRLSPVGSYRSNDWSIYDGTGNVREWVWAPPDPDGARITRGGGWTDGRHGARIAARAPQDPQERQPVTGLRIARTAP